MSGFAQALKATLHSRIVPQLDDAIEDYLVGVAAELQEEDRLTLDTLREALLPLLEQFASAPVPDDVFAALDVPAPVTRSKIAAAAHNGGHHGHHGQGGPGGGDNNNDDDDWGTQTVPVRKETNAMVDRIETAAERRRRERKEAKAAKEIERSAEREEQQIALEQSRGVAGQVTASGAVLASGGKRSNGDVHCRDVTISVGAGHELLSSASLRLVRGTRYGLIGRNGSGKSTLLTHIARREIAGFPADLDVLYVAQEVSGADTTALECVLRANAELLALREEEKAAANDAARALAVAQKLAAIDADGAEPRARAILSGLGFSLDMQNSPTKHLSGGWRMRAALASALFAAPDLLLLDEPTNGLSLDAVIWLENYLQTGLQPHTTLIVVSHDRVFLNSVVDAVVLLEERALKYFKGDVDTFEKTRTQQRLQQQRVRDAQLGQIAHMQKFVDRFRYNAKRASLAQSRLKAISRIEAVMADDAFQEPDMVLSFPDAGDVAGPALVAEDVAFGYAGQPLLFEHVDFSLAAGTRVCLLGANGMGKSTFLKLLAGALLPTAGSVRKSPAVRVATFSQHHVDQLDVKQTPLEFMLAQHPGITPADVRPHLARFGVTADLASQRIASLSGGQKSRVSFAACTFTRPHVLLLDEPSSHLDMETADALVMACCAWDGAVLIISHDQNLISAVPDELWLLEGGRITRLPGDDFAAYKRRLLKAGPVVG